MIIQGTTVAGLPANISAGPDSGDLLFSELHGRYVELSNRGKVGFAALQAGTALSTLSATATGFILSNPIGSGKNLFPLFMMFTPTTAPAGIANIHLAYGLKNAVAVVHTIPLTVRSGLLESFSPVGVADSAATLPAAPVIIAGLGGPVATGSISQPALFWEMAGVFGIPPGSNLSLGYLTTAISVVGGMVWEERNTN